MCFVFHLYYHYVINKDVLSDNTDIFLNRLIKFMFE